LGANGAAPENDLLLNKQAGVNSADVTAAPDSSDSAALRGDRLDAAAPPAAQQAPVTATADAAPEIAELPAAPAFLSPVPENLILGPDSLGSNAGNLSSAADTSDGVAGTAEQPPRELPLDALCQTLFTSAQDNDLPVPFFANLIWQESRLRDDTVSRAGALGIAQFMPEVAAETGLDDPFDPLQALPASARLLRMLREHFGNLGFVAAAYNAGAHRVSEWLQHHRALPRETRDYVVKVTGRSAEQWRATPVQDASLTFVRHLPCRDMPAFADLEQAQQQQAQAEVAQAQVKTAEAQPKTAPAAAKSTKIAEPKVAERRSLRDHQRRRDTRIASREEREERHHAERAGHEKLRSAHHDKGRSKTA
jgi:soluble lytic murein transglycosylase-like protein